MEISQGFIFVWMSLAIVGEEDAEGVCPFV
jgi:hypothetical protein